MVYGTGIRALNIKIYNRLGQVVFESSIQTVGWDGTYLGKPCEMDSYVYQLDGSYDDGEQFHLNGNISLIR